MRERRFEPIPANRYTLTLDEAGEYFGVGTDTMKRIIRTNKNTNYILWVNELPLIKREQFERFIDGANTINLV